MWGSSPPSVVKGDRKTPEQSAQTHKLGVRPFWAEQTVENSTVEPAMTPEGLQWMDAKRNWAEAENHPTQVADVIVVSMFWDHIGVPSDLICWIIYL